MGSGLLVTTGLSRLRALSAATWLLAVVLMSCGDPEPRPALPTGSVVTSTGTQATGLRLVDIAPLDRAGAVKYVWRRNDSPNALGVAIHRMNRALTRWDFATGASGAPAEGVFNVYRRSEPPAEYGCRWAVASAGRAYVEVSCVEGGIQHPVTDAFSAALDTMVIEVGPRVVGRVSTRCFQAAPIDEVCIDERGFIRRMETSGEDGWTLEAEFALDVSVPIGWPFEFLGEALSYPPAGINDTSQPSHVFEFPPEFHLDPLE